MARPLWGAASHQPRIDLHGIRPGDTDASIDNDCTDRPTVSGIDSDCRLSAALVEWRDLVTARLLAVVLVMKTGSQSSEDTAWSVRVAR